MTGSEDGSIHVYGVNSEKVSVQEGTQGGVSDKEEDMQSTVLQL